MPNIKVLSKEISELIAAGEVIERPSSVVKELVENSIDSGANLITVEIKNGGISYIRITDNGCGIVSGDVSVAFLRHATSKIKTKEDLDGIFTLGFRGEALASVSAVSKIDMITKRADDEYGTHFVIEGAEEKLLENCGCPDGTTIIIRDIFYNIPARLKFLKKSVTEGNAIASVVNKLALSHPEISFKLIRDNKQELFTSGDGQLYSAVYSSFGREFALSLLPVNYEYKGIKITGLTVKPLLAKSNRSFQNFFINGRYVKSMTCTVSLEEAYRNSIMTGKFPACVLNIQIPPSIIDVNVHPAKIEVRFSDEKLIFDSVYFAIKTALMENDTPTEMKIEEKPHFTKSELYDVKIVTQEPKQLTFSSARMESSHAPYLSSPDVQLQSQNDALLFESYEKEAEKKSDISDFNEFKYINNQSIIKKEDPLVEIEHQEPANITIIGEVFTTYIIAQANDEMLLIDKHAAHERIIFEKLKASGDDIDIQMLIEPIGVMLSFEEHDALANNIKKAEKLGFRFEKGIAPEISVTGIPVVIGSEDISALVCELAENFLRYKHEPTLDIFDELYHSIACRSAIKANDKSTIAELKAIVAEIYKSQNQIRYCPHGRPVMIKLSKRDIEKQFRRIV